MSLDSNWTPFSRDGGHEHLISNGGRFELAFAERDMNQTLVSRKGCEV
jgi:hypothetical protein